MKLEKLSENTYKILGKFGFIVEFHPSDVDVTFKAHRIISTDFDGVPYENELYLEGNVKWDGCMNWAQGHDHKYGHFCESEQIFKHCLLLEFIYKQSQSILTEIDPFYGEQFDEWPSLEDIK